MKKITFGLLVFLGLLTSLPTYAQNVTFKATDVSIQNLFSAIREQTGYTVFGNYEILEKLPKVSVNATELPLKDLLQQVLGSNNIDFAFEGKTIVLTEGKSFVVTKGTQSNNSFTGLVTDENGKPLAGAIIHNLGDSVQGKDVLTNENGYFTIRAKVKDVLAIYYVGYRYYNYAINNLKYIPTFQLSVDYKELQDLVVIGYGSARKKDLTGSVSTISGSSINSQPFLTVDNALAGKAAGVEVSKSDGTPGGAVRIRVRGTSSLLGGNDPLYIIDGVPVQVQTNYISPGYDISNPAANDATGNGGVAAGLSGAFVNGLNSLNGLNPDDIESISVLKDASSAAIYGSKASNGVVIITTKRGKNNMKPVISAGYYTTVSLPKLPKLLNASQYKELVTEAAQNSFNARSSSDYFPEELDMILNRPNEYFGSSNTDWLNVVTRNAISHNADLSVQGGSEVSKYYSSLSYNSTPGAMRGTDFDRISGKINLENKFGKKFSTMTNAIIGYSRQNITSGAYAQAIRARPDWSAYDASGNYTNFADMGYSYLGFQNPAALLSAINESKTFSFMGSLAAVYNISSALNFTSTVSLNRQSYDQRSFTPSYIATGGYGTSSGTNTAIGNNAHSTFTNWFWENTLTYNKTFHKKHTLNVLAGTSYETRKRSYFSATASGYPDDNYLTSLSSAVTPLLVEGDDPSKPQSYLVSFYLRANYAYLDKYLLTFTGRTDGSSKFGTNNKWGYFPSGAFAWRLSNENFMKDIKWLSDLKLRTSYGLLGNQNIGDQMYRTLYSTQSYGGQNALVPTQLGNDRIKWESTKEFDAGTDVGLFNNRLQVTFDYYDKRTSGTLFSLPVAPSTSYSTLLSNAVGIKNTGYELSISGTILTEKNFTWSGNFNISWNKSLVTHLASDAPLGQLGNLTGIEVNNTTLVEGQPLGLITGRKVTGIIKTQEQLDAYKSALGGYANILFPYLGLGDAMYTLTQYGTFGAMPNSNEIIAHAQPKYYGGFSQNLQYKGFGLQLYFTYSYGGSLLWADHVSSVEFVGKANANVAMLDRYNANNTNSDRPRLLYGDDAYYAKSNLDVFRSSFLKLRNVMVNYNFGNLKWFKNNGFKQLTGFVSASNLFTITKYPGNDPETSNDPYSSVGGYMDISNYPVIKTFSVGLKASF